MGINRPPTSFYDYGNWRTNACDITASQQTARIDVCHFYIDNEHPHKINPPEPAIKILFFLQVDAHICTHPCQIIILSQSDLTEPFSLQWPRFWSDYKWLITRLEVDHIWTGWKWFPVRSSVRVWCVGCMKYEVWTRSQICTIRNYITCFFIGVINGVCWRNWIAHLTTEDDHLCTVCCHQEVPGSSPG